MLAAIYLGAAMFLGAQTAIPQQEQTSESPSALERATQAPTEFDIYCAGFFTRRNVESGLFVLGGEEGVLKNEFADRDYIYLSSGRKLINAPGGQYMLIRALKDYNVGETFPGQHALVAKLGTLYTEVARIEVQILNEGSATARITHACEPVIAGDIAIPLVTRPAPPYKAVKFTDRFAPSSGKATGTIAAVKDFQAVAGPGHVVYFNIGRKQGAEVGNYLRVYRTYMSQRNDKVLASTRNYMTQMMGISEGHKLTREEMESVPRAVLGEVMILSVEDDSAVGIITYSLEDIYPGDGVELE